MAEDAFGFSFTKTVMKDGVNGIEADQEFQLPSIDFFEEISSYRMQLWLPCSKE